MSKFAFGFLSWKFSPQKILGNGIPSAEFLSCSGWLFENASWPYFVLLKVRGDVLSKKSFSSLQWNPSILGDFRPSDISQDEPLGAPWLELASLLEYTKKKGGLSLNGLILDSDKWTEHVQPVFWSFLALAANTWKSKCFDIFPLRIGRGLYVKQWSYVVGGNKNKLLRWKAFVDLVGIQLNSAGLKDELLLQMA